MDNGYSVGESGNKKWKVYLHNTYEIDRASKIGKRIEEWVQLLNKKQKKKSGKIFKISKATYFPTFQFELLQQKPQDEKCSICQFQYQSLSIDEIQKQLKSHHQNDIVALQCSHKIHYECLASYIGDKDWVKCPVCSTIYGKMIGDQPKGRMTHQVQHNTHCAGYPSCGTIFISYQMEGGKRGHVSYPGTSRGAMLPDNQQGREVLALLKQAFERKLIFTVGRSVTTGLDNQIVWNGIHHKTSLQGGAAYFGFPDPTYFKRVKLQLAEKGVS